MTIGQVVRRFWPDVRPLRWWLLLLVVLLAGAPLIAVLEVLLFQRLVDDVLVPATLGPLVWIAALYVGLNLLSAVISGVDDYLSTWISQRFLVRLRTQVFSHVLAHPSHVHDRNRLGDTMSRLTSDTAAVESFMIGQFATGTGAVLRLVIYAGALFWLSGSWPWSRWSPLPCSGGWPPTSPGWSRTSPANAAAGPARSARSPRSGCPTPPSCRPTTARPTRSRTTTGRTSPSPRPSWSAPGSARSSCRWPTWPSWSAPWR